MTSKRPTAVGLAPRAALAAVVLALTACPGGSRSENAPPSVPPPASIARPELDTFELSWLESSDDHTPAVDLVYEVGVVSSDVCIVVNPSHHLRGQTELVTRLPDDYPQTPLAGFTVRAVDEEGRSAGYGPCVWGLRAPLRLPVPITERAPRLRPPPEVGPALACRSDGHDDVWCESETELSHYRGARWQVFPLPQPFETVAWTPLDDYNALVRSDHVQLHLSRANGTSASVISSSSHRFDPGSGAISLGHLEASVVVNGFAAEFDTRYIDMAGPPEPALALPGSCNRLVQLGREFDLAFALCQVTDGHRLYLGEPARRSVRWRTDGVDVAGDHVDGVIGDMRTGLAAVSDPTGAVLYAWGPDALTTEPVPELTGEGRPIVAVSGNPDAPFVVAMRHFDYERWDGRSWEPLPEADGDVLWGDARFPQESHLVGTRDGVWAISEGRTVRLGPNGMELVVVHPAPGRVVRGHDARTYLLRGPELTEVLSSRDGVAWFDHGWQGPPLEPRDVAVTPSGGIWVSGATRQPDTPSVAWPTVRRLGNEELDQTPPMPIDGVEEVPELAADGRGLLYAYLLNHVEVLDPGLGDWHVIGPVPGRMHAFEGLENGALVALDTAEGPALFHCQAELCFEVPVPTAARRPWGLVQPAGDGFCVGVQSRALWCREGRDDRWIGVAVGDEMAARYHLGAEDVWDIVGAVALEDGPWLMALRTDSDGLLVSVDEATGEARVIASGLRWAEGHVLLPPDEISRELGRVVGVEVEGPVEIRYGDVRVAVPGTLYR